MDSMKELKDWLVTKCRLPGFHNTLKPDDAKFTANVVTPQTIPEFVIPGSAESSRNPSICSSDDLRSHSSGMSVTCSPSTSPAVSPRNSLAGLAVPENKSPIKVRSAPVSPRRDSLGFLRDFGARSLSNITNSKDNGQSEQEQGAAVEHTQFAKVKSNFAFSRDSPLFKRKEGGGGGGGGGSVYIKPEADHRLKAFMRRPFRSHESLVSHEAAGAAGGVAEHHPCLSASTSPRRCSPVFADQNDYLPLRESFRRSQRYYRRRSSLAQVEMTTAIWRQYRDSSSALGDSPVRRIPVHTLMTVPPDSCLQKRHSAPSEATAATGCLLTVSNHSSDPQPHEACSSGVPSRDHAERPLAEVVNGKEKTATERGDIKFSFQYFPATRRLKLLLIRAENLHFPERPDVMINPFFKVSLMPGKLQKQISETVKHTRNPMYNREFFFNDINMEELKNLRLRIKAFHKSQNFKLAEYLGEVNIPLSNYDLLMENRMWNDLHFKPYEQDLGHLQVELLLEPRDERLTVGVVQAKGLPSHHITGAPDPYVCASVEQCGQVIAERQTRTRKKSCDPVWREWFEVTLSCTVEALRDTRVRFCVYDHERLRSDPVLGEVWLGRGAREESVVTHWQEMMHAPGRKLRRWHYILSVGEMEAS